MIYCKAFALPRSGYGRDEYEDAASADAERGRFAIADGASESAFAGLWARLLAAEFVQASEGDAWDWLPTLQRRWADEVGVGTLPWYAETKFQQGAFATFLGFVLQERQWRAFAIGDSCLFQIREARLVRAFPLTDSCEFGTTPGLIGSRGFDPALLELRGQRAEGECQRGDYFWLMTDALAQLCLRRVEEQREPWTGLECLALDPIPEDAFEDWVERLRAEKQLRNDDVTALLIVP